MRKQSSLFNEVVTFINGLEVGDTYYVKDLIFFAGPKENVTRWKLFNKNPNYRIRSYQSMMRGLFVEKVKYGEWRVISKVPDWFDSGHLNIARNYKDSKDGMNRNLILEKLGKPVYKKEPITVDDNSKEDSKDEPIFLGNAFMMGNATPTKAPVFIASDGNNVFKYEMPKTLKLELDKESARGLLNCLARTSAKGKDLDVGEMIEDKLIKFLNNV
jgi:hypothetical protein